MAVTREKLIEGLNGTPWEVPALVQRLVSGPLDRSSIFLTLEEAQAYAASESLAYPGQRIAVVPESGEVTTYIIQKDGSLKEIGAPIDIVDNLETEDSTKVLSAKQGFVLNSLIGSLQSAMNSIVPVFIGTNAEYNELNSQGKIADGSIVIITDDNGIVNEGGDTTAALGKAILGLMVLGNN